MEIIAVTKRDPGAIKELAELGVVWMGQNWSLAHEPFLPKEAVV
jgi:hypothetical protein